MGHMNVQWYVAKFDEATWSLSSQLGITSEYIRDRNRGIAAVEQKIHYRHEALAGDLLVINSTVLEMKEKAIRFRHVMRHAETLKELADTELVGVHFDRITRKSIPFPEAIYEAGRVASRTGR